MILQFPIRIFVLIPLMTFHCDQRPVVVKIVGKPEPDPKIMNFFNPLNPIVIFVRLPGLIWLTEISIPKRSISRFSLVRRSVFEMRLRGWDSSSFKSSRRIASSQFWNMMTLTTQLRHRWRRDSPHARERATKRILYYSILGTKLNVGVFWARLIKLQSSRREWSLPQCSSCDEQQSEESCHTVSNRWDHHRRRRRKGRTKSVSKWAFATRMVSKIGLRALFRSWRSVRKNT